MTTTWHAPCPLDGSLREVIAASPLEVVTRCKLGHHEVVAQRHRATFRYRLTGIDPSGEHREIACDGDPARIARQAVEDGWSYVMVWEGDTLLAAQARDPRPKEATK